MHILLSTDANYVMPSAVMIKSVSINNADMEIVFHAMIDGSVDERQKEKLSRVLTNVKHKMEFHLMDAHFFEDFPELDGNKGGKKYITQATYYRLVVADVLPRFVHKVIYLDGDMIVRHSLGELWRIDIEKYPIGAVLDMSAGCIDYDRLEYDRKNEYFNAGILLINLDYWRENDVKTQFMTLITQEPHRIRFHDQDVLNITFCGKFYPIPLRYNVQNGFLWKPDYTGLGNLYEKYKDSLRDAIKDPVIVHYTGHEKPWQVEDGNPYGYEFLKYYKQTEWKYTELKHCYKNKYRHAIAEFLRKVHVFPPKYPYKRQDVMYYTWEDIMKM